MNDLKKATHLFVETIYGKTYVGEVGIVEEEGEEGDIVLIDPCAFNLMMVPSGPRLAGSAPEVTAIPTMMHLKLDDLLIHGDAVAAESELLEGSPILRMYLDTVTAGNRPSGLTPV